MRHGPLACVTLTLTPSNDSRRLPTVCRTRQLVQKQVPGKAAIKLQATFRGHLERVRASTRAFAVRAASLRAQRIQATFRGHVIRVRVRRDLGDALWLANRRRLRRPRTVREALQRTLRLVSDSAALTTILPLSLAMLPSVTASSSPS